MISCQNHKLPVECGRWQNIERNRRVCVLCQKPEIGDEYHYSMECHFLNIKITLLIKQRCIQNPNMINLKKLITSKNHQIKKDMRGIVYVIEINLFNLFSCYFLNYIILISIYG
jgi:hypothetical protein